MNIKKLEDRVNSEQNNKKLLGAYQKMQRLIQALEKKEIPTENLIVINADIELINSFSGTEKKLIQILKKTNSKIITFVEKELQFVIKQHYRSLGIVFGMFAGTMFSSISGSIGIMDIGTSTGMGILVGMVIGIIVGSYLDVKAEKNGLQLDL